MSSACLPYVYSVSGREESKSIKLIYELSGGGVPIAMSNL